MKTSALLFLSLCLQLPSVAESHDVTIRHAPYDVPNVSSKSEIARIKCRSCDRTTNYNKTYDWDVHKHEWVETTKPESIPYYCRHCKPKIDEQKRREEEERELDRRISDEKTKKRIKKKKTLLKTLRQEAR